MNARSPAPRGARARHVRGSSWWVRHLQRDLERDWTIPWQHAAAVSAEETRRIAWSIAEFQRGESSEAHSYLAASERFSALALDPSFHTASRLFVAAENLHADLLLRFMQRAGIPRCSRSAADGIFRRLRHLGDLGWASRILLIAELIAQEYYPCLRSATHDPALVRICDRVIAEEAGHIRFQVERILRVEAAHGPIDLVLRDALQRTLMLGTACVVYAGHYRVLGAKWSLPQFVARCSARLERTLAAVRTLRQSVLEPRETISRPLPAPHVSI